MSKDQNAYITLYLSLTLGLMLTFVFLLLESIRNESMKMETEIVMDTSLYSVFGEYHRQLLEQYDLFFIDTSYGQGKPDIKRCEEQIQYYMNQNFQKETIESPFVIKNLTNLFCDNVTLENYSYASDRQGNVLKEQIVEYMQDKKGITVAEKILSQFDSIKTGNYLNMNIENAWDEADHNLNKLIEEKKKKLQQEDPENEISIDFKHPAATVKEIKAQGILGMALPTEKKVSAMVIRPQYYFSHRQPLQGEGVLKVEKTILDQVTAKYLFLEYLLEKCGSYSKEKSTSVLEYQIEYLLHGKAGDLENLEAVMEDILHLREAINFVYLLSDSKRMTEADSMAALISILLLSPEIKDAVKVTIVFAWCYAESVKDVKILMDGHKLPMLKTENSWNTPLSDLVFFTSTLDHYKIPKEGVSYEDYLRFFLSLKSEKQLLKHFMDICEMDIRITQGNEYFQMDGCVNAIKAKANVSSINGNGYEIIRTYSYD